MDHFLEHTTNPTPDTALQYLLTHTPCKAVAVFCESENGTWQARYSLPASTSFDGKTWSCDLERNFSFSIPTEEQTCVLWVGTTREAKRPDLRAACQLLAMLLNKEKLLLSFKQIYKDTNFFSKDLFLANLTHEIKTPLNGVVGYCQLLLETSLTPTQKHYLHNMRQCSIQLMTIINDILDFSKLSSSKMTMATDCFSLPDVIHEVERSLNKDLRDKKQKLQFEVSPACPAYILMDRSKLVQILHNLTKNASKFSPPKAGISIKIRPHALGMLHVAVTDKGIGISKTDQCKLFNSFIQISNSITRLGSGLGLAICKKLVELFEGKISVESKVGTGSTFSFTCKYQSCEDYEETMETDISILKGKHVLLVDDNRENRIMITDLLFKLEMQPVVCASALEALRMVMANKKYELDIALIDVCMPYTSGVELARQIKEANPFLPMIALSSTDHVDCKDFEARLDKPVIMPQLVNLLCKLIKTHSACAASLSPERNPSPKHAAGNPHSQPSFLIVEDIKYNRTLMVDMLKALGKTNISVAVNGKDAIDQLGTHPFDIVFCDLRMPILDGFAVIEHVNKMDAKSRPQIAAVTASIMTQDKTRCRKMGLQYCIDKPINFTTFKKVLFKLEAEL